MLALTDHEESLVDVDASHEDGHMFGATILDARDDQGLVILVDLRENHSVSGAAHNQLIQMLNDVKEVNITHNVTTGLTKLGHFIDVQNC